MLWICAQVFVYMCSHWKYPSFAFNILFLSFIHTLCVYIRASIACSARIFLSCFTAGLLGVRVFVQSFPFVFTKQKEISEMLSPLRNSFCRHRCYGTRRKSKMEKEEEKQIEATPSSISWRIQFHTLYSKGFTLMNGHRKMNAHVASEVNYQ